MVYNTGFMNSSKTFTIRVFFDVESIDDAISGVLVNKNALFYAKYVADSLFSSLFVSL